MNMMTELESIFREVFEDDGLVLTRETTAADVTGWDSLQHVTMILHVESHFGIRFSSADVSDLNNVGELADLVVQRLAAPSSR